MEFYDLYPNSNAYDNNSVQSIDNNDNNNNNNKIKPIGNSNSSTNESLSQEEWDDLSNMDQYPTNKKNKKFNSSNSSSAIISRLKNEIAILREAVDVANGSDIEIMQTKLRVANADISKLRERNAEYKTRIQLLEQKLFDTIQNNNNTNKNDNDNNTNNNNDDDDDDDEFKDADYYDLNDNDTKALGLKSVASFKLNYEKLEKKYNFLQKLLSSLELRLQESQKVIDDQRILLNKKDNNNNNNDNNNINKKTMKRKDPTLKTLYTEIEPLINHLASGILLLTYLLIIFYYINNHHNIFYH